MMDGFNRLIAAYDLTGRTIKAIATTPAVFREIQNDVAALLARQGGELQIILSFTYPPGNVYAYSEWQNKEEGKES